MIQYSQEVKLFGNEETTINVEKKILNDDRQQKKNNKQIAKWRNNRDTKTTANAISIHLKHAVDKSVIKVQHWCVYFHSEYSTRYFLTCKICVLTFIRLRANTGQEIMIWLICFRFVANVRSRRKEKPNRNFFGNKMLRCRCQKMCHKRKKMSNQTRHHCLFLSSFIFFFLFQLFVYSNSHYIFIQQTCTVWSQFWISVFSIFALEVKTRWLLY